jgi:SAM-dependent methyltransferase
MRTFQELATDPRQYDLGEVDWTVDGSEEHYTRRLIRESIAPYLGNLAGKHALDIGCGQGWLCAELSRHGADVVGIEPSIKNIQAARRKLPHIDFRQTSLEDYNPIEPSDVVTASMVFEHLKSLEGSFAKARSLTAASGRFIILDGDFERFTAPRFGYSVDLQEIRKGEAATRTDYGERLGILYDIFRTPERFLEAAATTGWQTIEHASISAPGWLIAEAPQYAAFEDEPVFQLFVFENRS